jgi:hypothetical protein
VGAHLIAIGLIGHRPPRGAHVEPMLRHVGTDRCVECDRPIDGRGCWNSDGLGELVPYCRDCAQREFGASDTRPAA